MVAANAMRHKRRKAKDNENNASGGQDMNSTGQVRLASIALAMTLALAGSAIALDRGPVTNLPLPRFVSLKATEANVRRGPSLTHRIDWVFTRRGMPIEIIGEFGHWRRVRDRDGMGGWVHYALLSGARTGLVEADLAPLYSRTDTGSSVLARLEAGVIVAFDECALEWCKVRVEGLKGWMVKQGLWGVRPDEVFD